MRKSTILIFLLLGVLGSACKKPLKLGVVQDIASPSKPVQIWIDAPLPNAVLPLQPYTLVFHGSSPVGLNEFEVRINGISLATVPATPSSAGDPGPITLFLGEYLWSPLAPGSYLIEVRSGSAGGVHASAQVRVMIAGDDAEEPDQESPSPTASATTTATATLTPSATATATTEEVEACMLTALVNLFCRPGTGYEPVDSFSPGQTAPVIGQSQWLWKVIGANNGVECTVPKDETLVEVKGDCENAPDFVPLPPPTATPTATPRPTATPTEKPSGCTVRQPGGAIDCVVPCPAGAAPGNPCTP